jgi:hypothetical protein
LKKFPEWWVFWKGIPAERISDAVGYALVQPVDLPPPPQGTAATMPLNGARWVTWVPPGTVFTN